MFAPRQSLSGHLGRLQLADLALDTFPYTSHTTASDACGGRAAHHAPGRHLRQPGGGKRCTRRGAAQLATRTPEDYHRLALELATQPDRLAEMKSRLAANRMSCPLFDSGGFTRSRTPLCGDPSSRRHAPAHGQRGRRRGHSDSAEAHFSANHLDDLKRHEEAVACYRKALAIPPWFAGASALFAGTLNELSATRKRSQAASARSRSGRISPRRIITSQRAERADAPRPGVSELREGARTQARLCRGASIAASPRVCSVTRRHSQAFGAPSLSGPIYPRRTTWRRSMTGATARQSKVISKRDTHLCRGNTRFTPASICARGQIPSLAPDNRSLRERVVQSKSEFNHSVFGVARPRTQGTVPLRTTVCRNAISCLPGARATPLSCVPTRPGCVSGLSVR